MFNCEHDLLVNLIVLTPKLARKKFRQHIFEAWNWRCAYCNRQLTQDSATIDHILPKHKGGQNVRNNMMCSCSNCNKSKGSDLLDVWFSRDNRNFSEERLVKIQQWMQQKPCSIKLPFTEPSDFFNNDLSSGWLAA
jgi:CRISPR/Cas system Type II protein with McrA/HNH and RuvC-like nuclease domain